MSKIIINKWNYLGLSPKNSEKSELNNENIVDYVSTKKAKIKHKSKTRLTLEGILKDGDLNGVGVDTWGGRVGDGGSKEERGGMWPWGFI